MFFSLITHLLSTQTTKSWQMLRNNKFKAQNLNRKSYWKFTWSWFSVTCLKHVGLLWPISMLDRKQLRSYVCVTQPQWVNDSGHQWTLTTTWNVVVQVSVGPLIYLNLLLIRWCQSKWLKSSCEIPKQAHQLFIFGCLHLSPGSHFTYNLGACYPNLTKNVCGSYVKKNY